MVQHATFRSVRPVVLCLLAASVLVLVGPAAAGASTGSISGRATPKAATTTTTTTTTSLVDAGVTVETTNKVSWWLVVSWNDLGSEPTLGVGLEREFTSPSSGDELHLWSFNVNSSSFKFNDKTGTLNSGTQANPVAGVDLTFTTTTSKAATCTTGKETIYDGTLSGKVSLVTGLTGGGTVSGKYTFNIATPEVEVDAGCVAPAGDECGADLIAGSGNTTGAQLFAGTISDLNAATEQVVGVEEITDLSTPKGATRTDMVAMENESGKVYAKYTGSAVKISSTGPVSGSGTVSGGKPEKEPPESCSYDGKTYTDTTVIDSPAKYAGTFSATPSIGTTLTVPASTKTGIYFVTTAKAT
jgi:hypothetical protein